MTDFVHVNAKISTAPRPGPVLWFARFDTRESFAVAARSWDEAFEIIAVTHHEKIAGWSTCKHGPCHFDGHLYWMN